MKPLVLDIKEFNNNNKKIVMYQDIPVAILKYKDSYFAFDNRCPHRGSSLYMGNIKNNFISCPMHNWQFNLSDGSCIKNEMIKMKTFKTTIFKKNLVIYFD
tara:strand:- start:4724 stop:5026 length:303 start_codon:yes stop_codon:yes gene_type:complete